MKGKLVAGTPAARQGQEPSGREVTGLSVVSDRAERRPGPVRVLAISDEIDTSLGPQTLEVLRPDVVVSCGDLPFEYLEYVVTVANVPLLFVPGNHDPAVRPAPDPVVGALSDPSLALRDPPRAAMPEGCENLDGRIMRVAGLRFGGLGGSIRYSRGPNQYTQGEMRRRAFKLGLRAKVRGGLDVLVTHGAPLGVSDDDDPPHIGFAAFHRLVSRTHPAILVHGHIHPHGQVQADHSMGETRVVNVIPYKLLEVRR